MSLLLCSVNMQSSAHNKSSTISQFIKGKSRDFQKFLLYFRVIVTSKFKDGTGGCAGKSPSPEFPGCGGISGFSPTIFFYSNDLPSEVLLLTST